MKKQLDELKFKDILQTNELVLFKNVNLKKEKQRLKNCFKIKAIKEVWQLNAMFDSDFKQMLL